MHPARPYLEGWYYYPISLRQVCWPTPLKFWSPNPKKKKKSNEFPASRFTCGYQIWYQNNKKHHLSIFSYFRHRGSWGIFKTSLLQNVPSNSFLMRLCIFIEKETRAFFFMRPVFDEGGSDSSFCAKVERMPLSALMFTAPNRGNGKTLYPTSRTKASFFCSKLRTQHPGTWWCHCPETNRCNCWHLMYWDPLIFSITTTNF